MVLFDSGATHSFVSPSFSLRLDMRFDVLKSPLTVLTPVGEVYLINRFLSVCEVCIEDEILLVDLVELKIHEIDVNFGHGLVIRLSCSFGLFQQGSNVEYTK